MTLDGSVSTVLDKLWLWGHEAGSYNSSWGLPGESSMGPVEAVRYMGLSNLVMVVYGDRPQPPFGEAAGAMSPLDRVVWSIVGDSSSVRNNERSDIDEVIRLTERYPNVTGAIMDDFFREPDRRGSFSRYEPEDLASFRTRLQSAARPLGLWIVVYRHDLDRPIQPYLEHCDIVTFWTWQARDIPSLAEGLHRLHRIAPGKRYILGCYMWDFGCNQPMPVELMQFQCDAGLRLLQDGSIDGMIFVASCICDLGLAAVEWTREWISRVRNLPLPS